MKTLLGLIIALIFTLTTHVNAASLKGAGYDVCFITNTARLDTNGIYADSMFVAALEEADFNVNIPAFSDFLNHTLGFQAIVEGSDVVVISKTLTSADIDDYKEYWNKLQVPIVMLNPYAVRSNRLAWVPTSRVVYGHNYGVQEGKVKFPEDTIFHDVTMPSDSILDFSKDFLSFITFDSPEALASVNGKTLINMVNGVEAYNWNRQTDPSYFDTIQFSDYDGTPLMIRWEPLDSMYSGSNGVAARPFHYRTWIAGGDDHFGWHNPVTDTDELVYGMYMLSETLKTVFVNECAYLAGLEGPVIDDDNTLENILVSVGDLNPEFSSEVTNYLCEVPEGTTSVTINAIANSDGIAKVEGNDTYVFDGSDLNVIITVTSEAGTPREYQVLIKEKIIIENNIIPPGEGTINSYLENSDYEEYILLNNGVYTILDPIVIDRKITLKAKDTVTLPALNNLPVIENTYGFTSLIELRDKAELKLVGINLDGSGTASSAISYSSVEKGNIIEELYMNRCRIHNTSGDLISGSRFDSVTIKSVTIKNTFAYDAGGHGLYIKDVYAKGGNNDKYIFNNITFWNLGAQLIWIQVLDPDCYQEFEFDHMTGFKLSTDLSSSKELIGNSSDGGQYSISLTNTIFANQLSNSGDGAGSLRFTTENVNGDDNTFNLSNIALFDVMPVLPRVGSDPIPITNEFNADPQFADPNNNDFTIGNSDYLTAGDDGAILGATYWHPDFVDDYSDLIPGSSICTLDSIFINGDALYNFKSDTLSYVVKLADGLSIPIVAYTKTDEASFDTIINATDLTGTKEERTTTIKITSPNKALTKEYKIEFVILSNDATLSSILINYVPLEDFSPEKKDYQIDLVNNPASIPEVSYNVNHAGATAKAIQATNLEGTKEERTATISVVAENEVDSTLYTVLFNLPEYNSISMVENQSCWYYPTKVKSSITVNTKSDITRINILSISGKIVISEVVKGFGAIAFDLSSLTNGVYIIQAECKDSTFTGKFIKE